MRDERINAACTRPAGDKHDWQLVRYLDSGDTCYACEVERLTAENARKDMVVEAARRVWVLLFHGEEVPKFERRELGDALEKALYPDGEPASTRREPPEPQSKSQEKRFAIQSRSRDESN